MAQGLFTLRQQVQGIVQKAWNTPVGTYAGSFNGSSQYLSLPSIAAYTLSADFTIEFWVNATSYSSTGGGSPTVLSGTNTLNNWLVLVDSGTIAFYWNQTEIVAGGTTNIVGSWFHVAVVRSGSTVTIYKNGTRLNSATNASSFTLTSPLFIGQQNTGVGYWAGLISNVRIVKGTAVYTQNFAPPTTPLAAITNTSLLTLQNATIIDNSTNAATITNGGSVTTGAAMPFTQLKTPAVDYLVVAGGGGGGSNVGGGGGAGGLLQGSVSVVAGSSITVTVGSGGTAGTGGNAGGAGVNSVFGSISASGGGYGGGLASPTIGGAGGSGGGTGGTGTPWGYSISSAAGGQGVFGQGNTGAGSAGGGTAFYASGGGGAGTIGLSGASTYGGNGGAGIASAISGTVTAYGGGGGGGGGNSNTYGTGGTGGGGRGGGPAANAGNAAVGTANTGGGGGGGAAGGDAGATGGSGIVIVSYPDIYAGAASTTGSPTVSTSGSGSIYLAGSSNYLTYASNAAFGYGTGNFTEEMWIYPTASNWTSGNFYISDHGGNLLQFQYYLNALNWNSGAIVGSTTIPANAWSHIAIVRNSTTAVLYLNGTNIGSASSSTNFSTTSLTIGAYGGGGAGNAYQGYISNFRAVKGTAVYTGNFTPSATPLTAITNTSLLLNSVSGAYLADGSTNAFSPTVTGSAPWNQLSPFATGLGYKNRVYTYTGSGTITF